MKTVCLAVLHYNGLRHLEALLPSLREACRFSPVPASVVILDNGSPEGDRHWVRRHHPGMRWVEAPANDYLFSYNRLLVQIDDCVVVLLNNDLRVRADFLAPLLKRLECGDVFAVSGRGYNWEGVRITSGPARLRFENGFYGWRFDESRQEACHTLYCSGACMAVHREKFVALGGFNRLFHPAYCEDVDLCFRAWRRGWRCIYEPESVVYHRDHASWSVASSGQVNRLSLRNALLFQWSSLPMRRRRLERYARITNLIARGVLSGDPVWLKAWTAAVFSWMARRGRNRHLKVDETELAGLLERIEEPVRDGAAGSAFMRRAL